MHVLYITQTGLAEPLGRSQVIPYLSGLAALGTRFTVLSLERPADLACGASREAASLMPPGTHWIPLTYHARPPLASTAFDVAAAVARGILPRGVDLVHARSTVAALIARLVAGWKGVPWLFDVRGFLAMEYVDAGHWRAASYRARITAAIEKKLISTATGLVFLTERGRMLARTEAPVSRHQPSAVIPCAVDLHRFRFSAVERARRRAELGLEQERLLVYSGSLGSWYLAPEMMRFHAAMQVAGPSRFLVLTRQPELALREAAAAGVSETVIVRSASPNDVPSYLSAADAAIALVRPCPSKAASSPTKIAEYLACGLPVVANDGVGDLSALSTESPFVLLQTLDTDSLNRGAAALLARMADPQCREEARDLAHRRFSLDAAVQQYAALYGTLTHSERP